MPTAFDRNSGRILLPYISIVKADSFAHYNLVYWVNMLNFAIVYFNKYYCGDKFLIRNGAHGAVYVYLHLVMKRKFVSKGL